MTKQEAHKVLDAAKNGVPTPDWQINRALIETGDLCWTAGTYQVVKQAGTWGRVEHVNGPAGFWDGLAA